MKCRDEFWPKTQPYSLEDMLGNDEAVEEFAGGPVYQAFLSATNYHRWHSPVAGTIVRAFLVQGTYYSEADSLGADAVEPTDSQSYLAHVAARAVFLIRADNPPSAWSVSCRSACQRSAPVSFTRASSPGTMSTRARSSGTFSSEAPPTASSSDQE